ncbi:dihydrodipicolinate synthase family protein [Thalassotalea insulae]|uniref:Dihydrodipicolinate synthase family protein n=1 Tax=Thalassotalea insulae TaxID=2056778 RepID=A0ABQ6GUI5_9GAMM|nr:dihydrodipicolinate synthase family protein [Thalassotalea insulae]GLX78335.1 dihydrodipicolinate synthase family protein [Thalassotalea insulae]
MFTGLSAFPVTPFHDEKIDFSAYQRLITNLTNARVDSICATGSTGLYPYLTCDELSAVAKCTVELADNIPVMAGIGALRTADVLRNAEAVQKAGVSAVLLAPVSYHPLKENEVFSLYQRVTAELSVPLCVYENPGVTNFTFSDELYHNVSHLPKVAAIKIPGMPFATEQGVERLAQLRNIVPETVAIGVSGDKFGAAGIAAGCDLWLSVLGGLFPHTVKRLIHAAQSDQKVIQSAKKLDGLWELFARNKGGMRVMATAANILGYSEVNCLPQPLSPLAGEDRVMLANLLKQLQLD